jgi:phage terminase large subunit
VPEWYRKYVSLDYGLDSLAVLWIWMDNYGHARVYKALRKKNLVIAEAAKEIKIYTGPDKINAYYGPPDLWSRRNDTGKSAAMIFHENGINLIKASNNREHGWMNTHEWLRPYETRDEQTGETYKAARLTFDEGLDPDLWKHLTTIQRDEKNPNDVAVNPHEVTHYPDALRYFCAARPIMAKQPENEKKYNFSFERPQKRDSYFGGEVTSDYLNYGG